MRAVIATQASPKSRDRTTARARNAARPSRPLHRDCSGAGAFWRGRRRAPPAFAGPALGERPAGADDPRTVAATGIRSELLARGMPSRRLRRDTVVPAALGRRL